MQPYLFPYIGYFQLIAAVDIFVSLDDVNFIKRGYINRNNICVNGKKCRFSAPLKKASQNVLIDDVEVADEFPQWRDKFLRTLELGYGKCSHFREGMDCAEQVFTRGEKKISEINYYGLRLIANKLGLKTRFYKASDLGMPRTKGASRLAAIASHFKADCYVNPPGGKKLYSEEMFSPYGVDLRFLDPALKPYPMPVWIPALSILDAIAREGFGYIADKLLNGWKLTPVVKTTESDATRADDV
ncbi:MAG: WbqC family protein [Desulfovibrio sp.]|nr:WbqC family protein [Desulfovibrio sp.]